MKRLALGAIRLYQRRISPLFGPTCRYYPSCSAYAVTAISNAGLVKGSLLSAWRILRCNPWTQGGVDLPPGHPQTSTHTHSPRGDEQQ